MNLTLRTLLKATATAATLLATGTAHALEINTLNLLTQSEFRALSEDLGAALSYKALVPAEALGVIGFDIGVGVTATELQHRDVLAKAAGGADVPKALPVTSVRVVKGLPFNIDIGASLGRVPTTSTTTTGGELRWAFVPGGILTPAIAVRASHARLSGLDQLKASSTGLDVSISKGFLFATPYLGFGSVTTRSQVTGVTLLRSERFSQTRVFGGVNVNLGLVNLAIEADKTGDATSYGVKASFRF
jgi:hypothetical protein